MAHYDREVDIIFKYSESITSLTGIEEWTRRANNALNNHVVPHTSPDLKPFFSAPLSLDGLGVTTNITNDFTLASADFEFTAPEKTYLRRMTCVLRDNVSFESVFFAGLGFALGNGFSLIWKHPGETLLEPSSITETNHFYKWSTEVTYENNMSPDDSVLKMEYTFRDQLVLETGESLTIRIGGAAGDNTTNLTSFEFFVDGYTSLPIP